MLYPINSPAKRKDEKIWLEERRNEAENLRTNSKIKLSVLTKLNENAQLARYNKCAY